jgi:hypothetical protein
MCPIRAAEVFTIVPIQFLLYDASLSNVADDCYDLESKVVSVAVLPFADKVPNDVAAVLMSPFLVVMSTGMIVVKRTAANYNVDLDPDVPK